MKFILKMDEDDQILSSCWQFSCFPHRDFLASADQRENCFITRKNKTLLNQIIGLRSFLIRVNLVDCLRFLVWPTSYCKSLPTWTSHLLSLWVDTNNLQATCNKNYRSARAISQSVIITKWHLRASNLRLPYCQQTKFEETNFLCIVYIFWLQWTAPTIKKKCFLFL